MTTKLTPAQLEWLEFLNKGGPHRGDDFDNRLKGTCARRGWTEWDRQAKTWAIARIGKITLRRARAVQCVDNISSSSL